MVVAVLIGGAEAPGRSSSIRGAEGCRMGFPRVMPPVPPTLRASAALLVLCAVARLGGAPDTPAVLVSVSWEKTLIVSRTTPTLQVVVNPMLRPGSPIHDGALAALKAIHARYVRYVPWFPYPRLVVPELEPPSSAGTSWDFSLIDPMTTDFLEATRGEPTVMNFSTIPAWMFRTERPVAYPADPNGLAWDYVQGTELRDPSCREVGDYFARIVEWYTAGGFTDENGRRHSSGLHYEIPIWEVLNEVDFEHATTPRQYTERYDAIVAAVHRVSPKTQFMGLGLGAPSDDADLVEYFLDPSHHRPGTPIDYISYHFYATPAAAESPDTWQFTFFDQADRFLATVRYIEAIRKRLSPATRTDTNEIGSILPGDPGSLTGPPPSIPDRYWNAAGASFAYVFANLARQGIDIVGESQLVGYPSQFPTVTLVDWRNGKPNARYWVLKLLVDHFHPGDRLVETKAEGGDVFAQGFATPSGRSLLLVNRRNTPETVTLPAPGAVLETVDGATGEDAPRSETLGSATVRLAPFAVATASWR